MQLIKPDGTILTIPAQVIREAIQASGEFLVRLWSGDTSETIAVDQATHAAVENDTTVWCQFHGIIHRPIQ